jgi:excisionase family DNA binding protein
MTHESHQTTTRNRQSQLALAPAPAPDMAPANRETTARVDLSLPLVDADCIAELLCVKRKRIYELARRPDDPLPSVRIGRAVRFVRAQVEEWVAGQTPS